MSAPKHTPGPWHTRQRGQGLLICSGESDRPIVHAEIVGYNPTADALLIAASPKLLSAVQSFLTAYDAVKVGAGERFHLTTGMVNAFRDAASAATDVCADCGEPYGSNTLSCPTCNARPE